MRRPHANPRPLFSIFHFLFSIFALLLPSCNDSSPTASPSTLQLQIVSPHGSDIRREFADAFSAWHLAHFGQSVEILWPDIGGGGTGNIIRQLDAAYAHADTSSYDIMFGGGSVNFGTFISKDYLAPLPPLAPDELQKASWPTDPLANVPDQLLGTPLHGTASGNNLWTAATLSTFGMVINKDRLAELHLPTPRVWADLATPDFFGQLSLADPSKSGSVKTSYEMLLQQYGWEKGWPLLVQFFANASLLRESGAYPSDDVANAEALAGICIDFYGRLQIARVGPRVVAYIIPEGGTSLDADPIALLRGAPHPELAARFIRFVISPEGQRLWIDKPGTSGGPKKAALGRMSILKDLYTSDAAQLSDPQNPLQSPGMLKANPAQSAVRNSYLGELIKAALIDNHPALLRARRAIKNAGDPPDLLTQLTALPTFPTSKLDPTNNELLFSDQNPHPTSDDILFLSLTDSAQSQLNTQYAPPKSDPRQPFAEQIQNHLKDFWRTTFAQRFAQLESAARSRHP